MTLYVFAAAAILILFFSVAAAMASPADAANQGGDAIVYDANPTNKIQRFAGAVAFAEGFWDRENNVIVADRAARNNNPGDFLGTGDTGLSDGAYAVFSTLDMGWQKLYGQLQLIVDGKSHNYTLDMTISDMAYVYTATQQDAWAENVASYLNVTRDTPLRGLLT